jgi:hypothetical protein
MKIRSEFKPDTGNAVEDQGNHRESPQSDRRGAGKMSRISVFESCENGRVVTEYGKLPVPELERRIVFYEKKYGTTYARYGRQFDGDSALPWETSDLMDWQNLVEEKKQRAPRPVHARKPMRTRRGVLSRPGRVLKRT